MKSKLAYLALLAICSVAAASGQVPPGSNRSDLIRAARSDDPIARMRAFEALKAQPGGVGDPELVVELLERENELVESTWVESNGTSGIVDSYGEGFAEYIGQLAGECSAHCDHHDPRVVRALAGVFTGDSPGMVDLAVDHGAELLPMALEKAKSRWVEFQEKGLLMLGGIGGASRGLSDRQAASVDSALITCLSRSCEPIGGSAAAQAIATMIRLNPGISAERRLRMHDAIVAATANGDSMIRRAAVVALRDFRNSNDVALLNRISQEDPDASVRNEAHDVRLKLQIP